MTTTSFEPAPPAPPAAGEVEARVSRGLGAWLKERNVALLVSSYQSGRVVIIGADEAGKAVIRQERFDRAMGIAVKGDALIIATLSQMLLFRLSRRLQPGVSDAERILIPQAAYHTGFVNCHDVAWVGAGGGLPIFASVMFNCVGMVTPEASFTPVWAPPFITDFVPEDRCHLNGLAVEGGKLRFVTALGTGNEKQAWRADRSKGVIIDAALKRIVVAGLWLPHSPRILGRRLWLTESGRGSLGVIDRGKFVERLACPGYTRGLDFHGTVAAVGVSKPRPEAIVGLPLEQRLKESKAEPQSAVLLFDSAAGKVIHSVAFRSVVDEIYDVAFLPGTSNPRLIHPASEEAARAYHIGALKKAPPVTGPAPPSKKPPPGTAPMAKRTLQ